MLIVRVDNFEDEIKAAGGSGGDFNSGDDSRSGDDFNSWDDSSNYSMASITGAMYLLVASTTPDIRAGFSLLVDGLHLYHNVFGFVLLTLYALMISAAMKVLFADANDDASVVINAVAVLFIADVVSEDNHATIQLICHKRLRPGIGFAAIFCSAAQSQSTECYCHTIAVSPLLWWIRTTLIVGSLMCFFFLVWRYTPPSRCLLRCTNNMFCPTLDEVQSHSPECRNRCGDNAGCPSAGSTDLLLV